jgi:capsular exopolysaccharide synthesis family protein
MQRASEDYNQNVQNNSEHREINVEEIVQVILRRRVGIIVIFLLSLFSSVIIYYSQVPEFRATSVMMINQPQGSKDIVDVLLGSGTSDFKAAAKDLELLKSIPICEMTVERLWNSTKRDSLEIFDRRRYVSPSRNLISWLVPIQKINNSNELVAGTPAYNEMIRYYAIKMKDRIRVLNTVGTTILYVSVESPFAEESVALTNALCEEYKKFDVNRNSERYIQTNKFVAEMIKEQEQIMKNADNALSSFMRENKIYEDTGNSVALLTKMIESDSRYREAMADYRITLNSRDYLDKKLTDADRDISSKMLKAVNSQLATIQEDIHEKEIAYIKGLKEKNSNDPDVKKLKQELDQAKVRYEQISKSKIAGQIGYAGSTRKFNYDLVAEKLNMDQKLNMLRISGDEYNKLKGYYDQQLSILPDKAQTYVRLMRDRDVVSKTYYYLKEKLDESRILIGSEVGSVTMIGSAFKPFAPESPEMKRNILMGVVIGIVLSIMYVFSAEILDDRINYDLLFFKSLGFSVWGIVPLIPSFNSSKENGIVGVIKRQFRDKIKNVIKDKKIDQSQKGSDVLRSDSYPMMTDKLNSTFAESFRTLRTNLSFAKIDKPIKSLVVSGCSMGEGKSTVSANLAMAWAVADKKTIIIDADLRRPSQHNIFKKTRAMGLADCLVNNDLEINDRYIQKTHLDNLHFMSAGSPVLNPNELLGSDRMKTLIENLSQKYERLIIDSPPVFISDAAQLLGIVDGVLIAVRLGYSSKFTLKQYAYDSFIHSHIIGIVLIDNERPIKGVTDQGYGKYGYSRYGYGEYGGAYTETKNK